MTAGFWPRTSSDLESLRVRFQNSRGGSVLAPSFASFSSCSNFFVRSEMSDQIEDIVFLFSDVPSPTASIF